MGFCPFQDRSTVPAGNHSESLQGFANFGAIGVFDVLFEFKFIVLIILEFG